MKLAPGVRLNFSGSGVSMSFGPRGASVNVGKRGTYFNSGIPGTGLYAREQVSGSSSRTGRATAPAPKTATTHATISVEDDGSLVFKDAQGNPLSPTQIEQAKKQTGDAIRGLIVETCAKVNAPIEDLAHIHHDTPDPGPRQFYRPAPFEEPEPAEPRPKELGFLDRIFRSRTKRIADENAQSTANWRQQMTAWRARKAEFDQKEAVRRDFFERLILVDPAAMEQHLEATLQDIVWPRETEVSFDILDAGKTVVLDIDLPELEDMPKQIASVPGREYRLALKDMAGGKIQKLYMGHVHGVGFRIIGETFAALPTASLVVLSAYSQRPNKATGVVNDEYLYSVRVARERWQRLNFVNLANLDVVAALAQFELRREMTKTGVFKPVKPFSVG